MGIEPIIISVFYFKNKNNKKIYLIFIFLYFLKILILKLISRTIEQKRLYSIFIQNI